MVAPVTSVLRRGDFRFSFQGHTYPDGPDWVAESLVFHHDLTGLQVLVVLRNNTKFGIEGAAELAQGMNDARSVSDLSATLIFGSDDWTKFSTAFPLHVARAVHYQDAVRVFCRGREATFAPYVYIGEHTGAEYSGWDQFFQFVTKTSGIFQVNITPTVQYGDGLAYWLGDFDSLSYLASYGYADYCEGTGSLSRFGFYAYTDYLNNAYEFNLRVPTVDTEALALYTYGGRKDDVVRHFRPIPRQGELALQRWAWWWQWSRGEYHLDEMRFWVHNITQDMPESYDQGGIAEINRRARLLLHARTGQLRLDGGELGRRLLDVVSIAYLGHAEQVLSPTSRYWISGISHRITGGIWETEYEVARPGT